MRQVTILIGWALVGICVAFGAIAIADGPTASTAEQLPELSGHDQMLLRTLSDPSWRKRKDAAAELFGRGVAAVPTIKAMLEQTDNPEAEAQLHSLLERLANEKEVGASLITLHVQQAMAKDVYTELFRQAGVTLRPSQPADLLDKAPPITLDVDHRPFWEVFLKLYKEEKIGMDHDHSGGCYLRPAKGLAGGPTVFSGPFRMVIPSYGILTTDRKDYGIVYRITVYAEPKLQLLSIEPYMEVDATIDDKGHSLQQIPVPPDICQCSVPTETAPGIWGIDVYLKYPDVEGGTRLTRLKGKLLCTVALSVHHLEIPHPQNAEPQTVDLGFTRLTFEGIQQQTVHQGVYNVATFSFGPDPREEIKDELRPRERFHAYDADGKPTPQVTISDADQPGKIFFYFTHANDEFARHPPHVPVKIVWDLPDTVRTVEVPVDFTDMRLPYRRGIH